jgi:hypothetical protein
VQSTGISSDNYLAPFYHIDQSSSVESREIPVLAGAMSSVRIAVAVAPNNGGGTQSWTFHVVRNGTNVASQNCTISEAVTTCTIAGPVTFTNGQRFALFADAINSPATTRIAYTAEYDFD